MHGCVEWRARQTGRTSNLRAGSHRDGESLSLDHLTPPVEVCVCVCGGGGKEGKGEGKVGTVSKEGKEKKKATGEGDERKEEERKKNRVRRTNEQWREDKEQTLTAVAH